MSRGITENDVWQAADAVLLEGGRPTIERVRQKIGRGSPNTVTPHLDAWFKRLGARIRDPKAFSAPPDLPDPVHQAAQHLWESAMSVARGEAKSAVERAEHQAAEAVAASLADAQRAQEAEKEARAAFERQSGDLAECRARVLELAQEVAACAARLEESRIAVTSGRERLEQQEARERAAMLELRGLLNAANDRADAADRRVALELERERRLRAKAEKDLEERDKRGERERAGFEARLKQLEERALASEGRETELLQELRTCQAALAGATADLTASRLASEQQGAAAAAANAKAEALQGALDQLTKVMQSTSTAPGQDAQPGRSEKRPKQARKA